MDSDSGMTVCKSEAYQTLWIFNHMIYSEVKGCKVLYTILSHWKNLLNAWKDITKIKIVTPG